jgi:DNA-binding Xre family transcriptional regulator
MRVGDGRLRVVTGEVAPVVETRDPQRFQAECVESFVASWTARGFAASTIDNDVGVLERMLAALGRPVWEVTADDIDRVVGELASAGRAVSTRRNYLQVFKGFHRFLEVRKAAEIEAAFGVRLACPLDEFNAARHVSDDSPSVDAPPAPERVTVFFEFLKERIATARKYAPAARDYALFRTLYHAGLRSEEVVMLDRRRALRAWPVRQAARAFRQGRQGIRSATAVGADARRPGSGVALVSRRRAWPVPGQPGAAVRRVRRPDGRSHHPEPAAALDERGRSTGIRLVQSARDAPRMRDPQLRARRGSRCHPTTLRTLDGRIDHAVRAAVGNLHRRRLPTRDLGGADRADRTGVNKLQIRWKLRMAAAQREVWTGAQLQRLLAEKAGLELSSASVSALFTKQPSQLKLSTLIALCTALDCTPNDLFDIDTTPVAQPVSPKSTPVAVNDTSGSRRGRSMPPI